MLKNLRSRLTYANVMATIAVFLALGGAGAWATHEMILSSDIVNSEVLSQDINDVNGVRSADVRDDTLSAGGLAAVDLRANAVGQGEIASGAVGTSEFGTIPAARAHHSADQSISNETSTVLSLDSEEFDTDNLHDTATNNSRLTAPVAGVYQINGRVAWAVDSDGFRSIAINSNLLGTLAEDRAAPVPAAAENGTPEQNMSTLARLDAGDFVELSVFQNSGGALNSLVGADVPELSMHWVGP